MNGILAEAILKMLALAGVGIALRASGLVRREQAKVLNAVIINVALPALVFRVARQTDLSWDLVRVAGIAWVVGLVGFGAAWVIARALKLPRRTAAGFMLVTALGNTGYIGYPVTSMLFGDGALPQAVFYDVFGTVALLFTVGIMVASRFGDHDGGKVSPVRELMSAPAMVALLAGLASRLIPLPASVSAPVMDWLGIVANMTVPLVMISLGLTLSGQGFKGRVSAITLAGAIKLLALPGVALIAALILGERAGLPVVMLQAGMPSMMLSLVVGERFGLDTEFIASAILVTTVACVISIPVVQMLVP